MKPFNLQELMSAAQDRVDAICTSEQGRLILAGLNGNTVARRALSLAASFGEGEPIPKVAFDHLLALPKNRFGSLYDSLQLCGALVPVPLDETQWAKLASTIELNHSDGILRGGISHVLTIWRKNYGDTLNPALGLLLRAEMEAA